jgi:hypothetical protein
MTGMPSGHPGIKVGYRKMAIGVYAAAGGSGDICSPFGESHLRHILVTGFSSLQPGRNRSYSSGYFAPRARFPAARECAGPHTLRVITMVISCRW